MKKKIAILGSTGSIGKTLIKIIKKEKKNFEIILLSADENYKELLKQAKFFKVKNLIINNKNSFDKIKKNNYSKKIKIYNNFNEMHKIFKTKIDYTMSSISGLDGLSPTLKIIKYSKKIAIANKEAIICGWNLINKNLLKYKTEFIPVDSEHFSIWSLIKDKRKKIINKVYITASGGPFLYWSLKKIKNVPPKKALKHPNWSMGKKISIDSATMMNKVFEVIETQRIFDLPRAKINILIHEKSYIHAIVEFKNGLKKLLAHDTNMSIPIFNTVYEHENEYSGNKNLNLKNLNNLNFKLVDLKRFPLVKILKKIPEKNSLFETVLVSANDELVNLYLNKKISFYDLQKKLQNFIDLNEFAKLKKKKPRNINEIYNLNDYVRLKIRKLCI